LIRADAVNHSNDSKSKVLLPKGDQVEPSRALSNAVAAMSYKVTPPARPSRDPSYDTNPMQQLRSAQTVNMSAELFEKLFLQQQYATQAQRSGRSSFDDDAVGADWRKSLGNPTPM
jgi:hypothetical protein